MTGQLNTEISRIISDYNLSWLDHGSAYFTLDPQGSLGVKIVKALPNESLLSRKPTEKTYKKSYFITAEFLEKQADFIVYQDSNHRDFMSRIQQSFTHKKCGYHFTFLDVDKKIALIQSRALGSSDEDDNLKIVEFNNYIKAFLQTPLSKALPKKFPIDCCDIIFLLGKKQEPVPAHKFMLFRRNNKWAEFINENKIVSSKNFLVYLPNTTPTTFLSLLNIIYKDLYPTQMKTLLKISFIADALNEPKILKTCNYLLQNLILSSKNSYSSCVEFSKYNDIFNTNKTFPYEIKHLRNLIAERIITEMIANDDKVDKKLVTQILSSNVQIQQSEFQLYNFVIKHRFFDLLAIIRFEWIPHDIFMKNIFNSKHIHNEIINRFTYITWYYQCHAQMPNLYENYYCRPSRSRNHIQVFESESAIGNVITLNCNLPVNLPRGSLHKFHFQMLESDWKAEFIKSKLNKGYELVLFGGDPKQYLSSDYTLEVTLAGETNTYRTKSIKFEVDDHENPYCVIGFSGKHFSSFPKKFILAGHLNLSMKITYKILNTVNADGS